MAHHKLNRRLLTLLALLVLLVPVLAACGGTPAAQNTPGTAAQATTAPATQPTTAAAAQPTTAAPAAGETETTAAPTEAAAAPTEGDAAATTPATGGDTATGAGQETITIGMSQEPPDLLPLFGSAYVSTIVEEAIDDSLVQRNEKNEYVPQIAKSVPTIENGGAKLTGSGANAQLTVTYQLRDDVTWHDGEKFTADDVIAGYNLLKNPNFKTPSAFVYRDQLASVKKNGDYEVVFTYKKGELDPTYYIVGNIGIPSHITNKVDPAKWDDPKANPLVNKPVGTGPYRFVSQNPERVVLQSYDKYFLGTPKTKNVIFRIIPDTQALLSQLQAGELNASTEDAHQINQFEDLKALEGRGVKTYTVPAATWEHIDLNLSVPVLQDKRVRQALMYGIDRKTITEQILFGQTQPLNSWLTPTNWAYTEKGLNKYEYNPEKAGQLLDQAGLKLDEEQGVRVFKGQPVTLELMTTAGNELRAQTTQLIQQNLSDLGLLVSLSYQPAAIYFGDPPDAPLAGRKYQMGLYAWVSGDDPAGFELYHSSQIPSKENNYTGQNYPGWKNERNDQLLKQANQREITREKRLPLYAEQQKIFNEELPVLPLYQRVNISTAANGLQNWKPTPTNTPPTWNAHEWVLNK